VAVLFGMQRPHLRGGALAFQQCGDLRELLVDARAQGRLQRGQRMQDRRGGDLAIGAQARERGERIDEHRGRIGAPRKGSPSTCSIASRNAGAMVSAGGCANSEPRSKAGVVAGAAFTACGGSTVMPKVA
jgi:hypothetical protein